MAQLPDPDKLSLGKSITGAPPPRFIQTLIHTRVGVIIISCNQLHDTDNFVNINTATTAKFKNLGDMIIFLSIRHYLSCTILNSLKVINVIIRYAI